MAEGEAVEERPMEMQTWMFEELGDAIGGFHDEQPKPMWR